MFWFERIPAGPGMFKVSPEVILSVILSGTELASYLPLSWRLSEI